MDIQVRREVAEVKTVQGVFDVVELAGRYNVALSYEPVEKEYTVIVPTFKIAFTSSNPTDCAYKLMERGMYKADAEAVQEIITKHLYPQFK